jgi:PST family polysaccharide transporter
MNFYRGLNPILLGFMTDYRIVGLYAPAEKLAKAAQSLTTPIVNALYPYVGRKFGLSSDKQTLLRKFNRIGILYSGGLLVYTLVAILLSGFVVRIFLGFDSIPTTLDLRILCLMILFGGLNYYYGILGLVNLNKAKEFSYYVWIAGGVSISSCFVLIPYWQDMGASIAMVLAEAVLLILIYQKILQCKSK